MIKITAKHSFFKEEVQVRERFRTHKKFNDLPYKAPLPDVSTEESTAEHAWHSWQLTAAKCELQEPQRKMPRLVVWSVLQRVPQRVLQRVLRWVLRRVLRRDHWVLKQDLQRLLHRLGDCNWRRIRRLSRLSGVLKREKDRPSEAKRSPEWAPSPDAGGQKEKRNEHSLSHQKKWEDSELFSGFS